MAQIDFPLVTGSEFTPEVFAPGYVAQSGRYSRVPVQTLTTGVANWRGTWTFPKLRRDHPNAAAIIAFARLAFVGNTFDLPLWQVAHSTANRFPAKDETTDALSVQCTGRSPDPQPAREVGTTGTLILDTGGTTTTGFRLADWLSLHSADLRTHYGAFQCNGDQVGTRVSVTPFPATLPVGGLRVLSRRPTLRAYITDAANAPPYTGVFVGPWTFSWAAATPE